MGHWILELFGAPHLRQRHGAIDMVSPSRNRIVRRHDSLPKISLAPL